VAHTVVLHIGAMKSGTSYIQRNLGANRDVLASQGFLFPGEAWRQQVLGVLDVLDQTRDGDVVPGSPGAWQRLVDEIAAFDGTAVISMEFLGPTPAADIQRVVDSLAPADVKVVMTVRDLGRNIPAMWQEGLKNGTSWGWTEYLRDIEHPEDDQQLGHAKKFWRHMNFPFIARKWVRAVGKDHFTLVTVPHPGADPSLLWERFCSVVGLDPEPFDTSGRSNASLGAPSALVLRALNEALPERFPLARYQKVVKHSLAKKGMTARAEDEPSIGFEADWVTKRSAKHIEKLRKMDITVVGDLEELRPVPQKGVDPSEVPVEDQLEASIAALRYLVRMWPSP
jgi:hypothetical protein